MGQLDYTVQRDLKWSQFGWLLETERELFVTIRFNLKLTEASQRPTYVRLREFDQSFNEYFLGPRFHRKPSSERASFDAIVETGRQSGKTDAHLLLKLPPGATDNIAYRWRSVVYANHLSRHFTELCIHRGICSPGGSVKFCWIKPDGQPRIANYILKQNPRSILGSDEF
jgi:hypothetical protein